MNKVSRIAARGVLAVIALALPQPAGATCQYTQPVQHGLGSYFTNCPDAQPVEGYLYVLGQDATLNSNSTTPGAGADQKIDFVCEAAGVQTEQSLDCFPEAGASGDGNVTVQYDWGGVNLSSGDTCPNPLGVPGVGRNVIQIMANDGSSLLATVGFSVDYGYYLVEAAGPEDLSPLSCTPVSLTLVSITSEPQGYTACFRQSVPPVRSDCDPGTLGSSTLNTCQGGTGTPVTVTPGNVYTRTGSCFLPPGDVRRASWTPVVTTPGPGGSQCVVVTPPDGHTCPYIGLTSFLGDGANPPAETPALTGWLRIHCGICAAVDGVGIEKAEFLKGRLRVDFSTENEATIVGFNVYGGAAKLNSGLIPALGQGSNDYSFEVGRGALKNERSITVEAVMSDGTTARSAAVSVK